MITLPELLAQLPNTQLVAVSKYQTQTAIKNLYAEGQRRFAESRAQELEDKALALPADIEWHFIGHLQTNKIKTIYPHTSVIQSIDSEKLLFAVEAEGARLHRSIKVLLQLKIAKEDTKYGFSEADLVLLLRQAAIKNLKYVQIIGLMGMASNTDDENVILAEFMHLKTLFDTIKQQFYSNNDAASDNFKELSIGMSGDYLLAKQAGSTMVRIGSLLFA